MNVPLKGSELKPEDNIKLGGKEIYLVIGDSSEVGKQQIVALTARKVGTIIGTSRNALENPLLDGKETLGASFVAPHMPGLVGIDFSTEQTIKSGVSSMVFLLGLDNTTASDNISIHFNPMRETGIENKSLHFLLSALIEEGVSPDSLKGINITSFDKTSYISYGPRKVKDDIIASAKEDIVVNGTTYNFTDIVKECDFLTFDSKSANAIGFTFLGVAGEFLQFLETHPHHEITNRIREELQGFLGDTYHGVLRLFGRLPFRGDLIEGQESMKELDNEKKLKPILNSVSKEIDFAKLSYIAPLISKLYLELTIHNQLSSEMQCEHKLFDWPTISQHYEIDISDTLDTLTQKIRGQQYGKEEWVYKEMSRDENTGEITMNFNASHLETIDEHFGIIPAVLAENNLRNIGLLDEGESVNKVSPGSMTLTGYNITVKRIGNEIIVKNAENPNHTLFMAEVGEALMIDLDDSEADSKAIQRKGSFQLPDEDKVVDNASFPHRESWAAANFERPQTHIGGIEINLKSSIKEHIGFRLANMILNNPNPEIIENFKKSFMAKGGNLSRLKRLAPAGLQGIFGGITQFNVVEDFEELLMGENGQTKRPDVEIIDASFAGGLSIVTQESIDGKVISGHKFMLF